ncbi:hypothetical protein KAR02_06230, partial [Candidatus Bipolaricaulota bacterium]|nr:hypothetical protein [Candidatus Bipolaricaulota bacterium]
MSIGTTTADGSGEWSFYSTGGTVLGDGAYSFSATAEDDAGNTSETSSAFDVLIDTQAPPPPASDGRSPADSSYTNDRTPTFSWSEPVDPGDSGIADYHIQIIDSDLNVEKDSYTSTETYTPTLYDGTYTWKLATRDVAGNTSAWGDEWTLVVDASEPNVYLSAPSGGEYWAGGSSQTITWSAYDRPTSAPNFGPTPIDLHYSTDGGWNWVEIAIGEANDGSYTWNPIPTLNVTTLKLRATATDLAGNSDTSLHYDYVTIDSTIPETTGLDLPDTEQSVDENCTITIPYSATVTDNVCIDAGTVSVVVEFVSGAGTAVLTAQPATSVNQGGSPNTQVNVSGSFTVSDLCAGAVEIRVRISAADCAGNTAIDVSDIVTIGDSTIPVIGGLNLPVTDQSVNEACTITIPYSATVTDNCCVEAGSVNVVVEFVDPFNTATLTAPPALIIDSGGGIPNDT